MSGSIETNPPFRASTARSVSLAGPAGRLETLVDEAVPSTGTGDSIAVVCHPHPQHQGTMHNKVVHALARYFARRGTSAWRFNYRGVGVSEGVYDGGAGEVDDALAVVDAALATRPGAALYLAGFSFGGMVAIRAALRRPVHALITVAPAIRFFDPAFAPPTCPWLVIQGEADDIVPAADVRQWLRLLDPAPDLVTLSGVGHYFHGALGEIATASDAFFGRNGGGTQPAAQAATC